MFVMKLNLHIAFFGEIWIREVYIDCRYKENNSGNQKEEIEWNEDWPKIQVKIMIQINLLNEKSM